MTFTDTIPTRFAEEFLRTLYLKTAESHHRRQKEDRRTKTVEMLPWAQQFLPNHFAKPPSTMHRWLAATLDSMPCQGGVKLNVLAPRGAAKSTIGTLAFPLRESLEARQPYIWIVSDTMSQAHSHLENIKTELTSNPHIEKYYPHVFGKGEMWRGGAIVLRNGCAIEAYGTGQRLRGRRRKEHRPTLIICDDLQNDNHIVSATARDKSRSWFHGTLLKAGTQNTLVLNLATALHREAIAVELTAKPGWMSQTFQAITEWPNNMAIWEEWESIYSQATDEQSTEKAREFYRQHREIMEDGARVLWPEHEDLYTLMKMRCESGRTAFEREKQNSPVNPEYCEWPESYFDDTIWYEKLPSSLLLRAIALDPSKGTDCRRGDFSALVFVGLAADGVFYVDSDLARRSVTEIVDSGIAFYQKYPCDIFGIETNQFQELLQQDFHRALAANGIYTLSPVGIENRINKRVRIRRLGPLLAAKRLRFCGQSPSTKLLVNQLMTFPVGDHDDGPDALEMAIRLIDQYTQQQIPFADGFGNRLPIRTV